MNNIAPNSNPISTQPQQQQTNIPYDWERGKGQPVQNFRFPPMAPGQSVPNEYQAPNHGRNPITAAGNQSRRPVDHDRPPHLDTNHSVNHGANLHNQDQCLFHGNQGSRPTNGGPGHRMGGYGGPNAPAPGPPGPPPPGLPPPLGPPPPPGGFPGGQGPNSWGPPDNYPPYHPGFFNPDEVEWGPYYPAHNYHYPDKRANAATWYGIPR
jgi:hypothetical protein